MASLTCPVLLLCQIITQSLFIFYRCVATPLNEFKKWQVYEPETEMVHDAHLLRLNVNKSYNDNMNLVDLSDKLRNVYRVDHWMRKYKWWYYIFYFGFMASSLSMHTLLTKHYMKRARRIP